MLQNPWLRRWVLAAALASCVAVPVRADGGVTANGVVKAWNYASCSMAIFVAHDWASGWLAASSCLKLYLAEAH